MNRFLRSTAAFVTAAVMLSGCTAPGMNNNGGKRHEMSDSYSYTPEEEQRSEQAYTWLIKPSIQADNIISFDASRIDPDHIENRAFINYSVIRQSGKYGLIDYAGNIIVKPEWDDYYVCSCGEIVLLNVIDDRKKEYEYCTVDEDKLLSDTPKHTEDTSHVFYVDIQSGKIFEGVRGGTEVTEYKGKKAVAVTQANITLEDNGTAFTVSVPDDALCGMAKEGELIVDAQYDAYYAPAYKGAGSTAIAFRNASGKWGYFDDEGNMIIDFIADGDPNAYNGMVTDDQLLIHPYLFCDDYIPVYKDGYYSFYDYSGEQVVRAGEFAQARPINNGRAWVKQNEFWGVIQMGEIVEEERRKDDSSSQASSTSTYMTYWTDDSSQTDDSAAYTVATDVNGNPITTTTADPNGTFWSDLNTDTGLSTDTGAYTEPSYTEPVYTEPAYTEPVYTEPAAPVPADPTAPIQ